MELNIYQYKNYRDFLKDFYVGKKKFNPRYSYAVFSQKSGIASPNYLKRVMDGTRNITHNNLRNFIMGLSLGKKEATYFENLVHFNQTEQKEVKSFYFGELSKVSKNKEDSAFKIDAQFYEYLSHWFYVAIHELVNLSDFKEDLDWICAALKNKITKPQAKKALELLIKMGFLKRKEYTAEVIHSNPLVRTTNIGQYAIKEKRKSIVFSIGGGYGTSLSIIKLEPYIGLHVGFPLISF